jgi:hypothetical protein
MKKSNLFRLVLALVLIAFIFSAGCSKEKGDYDSPNIVSTTSLNTYDYLKSKPGVYDSLLMLVDKLGLQNVLRDSNVTLFAVSNKSFESALKNLNDSRKAKDYTAMNLSKLISGIPETVAETGKAKADSANLDSMVTRYIIKGKHLSSDLAIGDGKDFNSYRSNFRMHGKRIYSDAQGLAMGGPEYIEFANTKGSNFVANWALSTTSSVNIQTKNGVVHLLNSDHVFGFDEFSRRLTYVPAPENLFTSLIGNMWTVKFNNPTYVDGSISGATKFDKFTDGTPLTKFIFTATGGNLPVTCTWIAPYPVVSNCYQLSSANDSKTYPARNPKSWRIEGSQDGLSWTVLDTRQDMGFEYNYQYKIFDFKNEVPYKQYRIIFLSNGGDTYIQLGEWTMNYRKIYK